MSYFFPTCSPFLGHLVVPYEANTVGENSSFIFLCYVKTVSLCDFKLIWILLHLTVKKVFSKHIAKKSKITMFC